MNILYVTAPDSETAASITNSLLEKRLIACANIIENVTSIYWWEGKINNEKEVIIIAKTTNDLIDKAIDAIKATHPYDCPCITSIKTDKTNQQFLEWVDSVVD